MHAYNVIIIAISVYWDRRPINHHRSSFALHRINNKKTASKTSSDRLLHTNTTFFLASAQWLLFSFFAHSLSLVLILQFFRIRVKFYGIISFCIVLRQLSRKFTARVDIVWARQLGEEWEIAFQKMFTIQLTRRTCRNNRVWGIRFHGKEHILNSHHFTCVWCNLISHHRCRKTWIGLCVMSVLTVFAALWWLTKDEDPNILEQFEKKRWRREIPNPEVPLPSSSSVLHTFRYAAVSSDTQACSEIAR